MNIEDVAAEIVCASEEAAKRLVIEQEIERICAEVYKTAYTYLYSTLDVHGQQQRVIAARTAQAARLVLRAELLHQSPFGSKDASA